MLSFKSVDFSPYSSLHLSKIFGGQMIWWYHFWHHFKSYFSWFLKKFIIENFQTACYLTVAFLSTHLIMLLICVTSSVKQTKSFFQKKCSSWIYVLINLLSKTHLSETLKLNKWIFLSYQWNENNSFFFESFSQFFRAAERKLRPKLMTIFIFTLTFSITLIIF